MNKKKIGFLGILSSFFLANLLPVYAQDGLVEEWLRFIFFDLSDLAESGDQIFIIYSKIILFFLVFVVIFWSSEKIFNEKAKIAGTVAFIISLISVTLLPGEVILIIFKTYSVIIGYAFVLLPVIVGLIVASKLGGGKEAWKKFFKGVVFIVIAILTFSLATTLIAEGSDVYSEVAKWAKIGGVIALLVGIFYIITCWKGPGITAPIK